MVWIPQQLVGAPVGYNVTLECFIEAYPISLNYWSKDDNDMIHDSSKYKLVMFIQILSSNIGPGKKFNQLFLSVSFSFIFVLFVSVFVDVHFHLERIQS